MHALDWALFVGLLVWIVYDGIRRTHDSHEIEGYFLAKRSIPWWAAGISVMATQLSAITMIGTTGQGYQDGLRFIQFYYGLPIAMIILSMTLVPFFYRSGVYTAYEYLERRFDGKTRLFTSFLFLLSRGMSCGAVVAAPAVVLSLLLGWNLSLTAILITAPAVVYTMFGGVQAVTWTDVKIMFLVVGGMMAVIVFAILGLPGHVGVSDGLAVAGATGRLNAFDWSFDLTNPYTIWSGTLAAVFLFCSYFGTDQSQVQRYLTARSVDEARRSLLMSAYWKIPLQVLVLLLGIFVFLFYVFNQPPMLFSAADTARLKNGPAAASYAQLETEFTQAFETRRNAATGLAAARSGGNPDAVAQAKTSVRETDVALQKVRTRASALVQETSGRSFSDVNYIIPNFILTQLPMGLVGLLILAIVLAATDTIAGELNSLATATVIDFYKRSYRTAETDRHYLTVSKIATGLWGLFACIVALWAAQQGSLVEVVNKYGSFFYGSILGVFILAVGFRQANGTGAFVGLIAGMSVVAYVATSTPIAFLWQNVIGAAVVVAVGLLVSAFARGRGQPHASSV
jgi:SSS family solute:Na+ symporter